MVDAGKLTLGVVWDGKSVTATEIRSTRPMPAQILKGRMPAQVLQIVPMLFSLCGQAQRAAAAAAMHAAQHSSPPATGTERAIACEAMQEHLWRLMLDWPKLLGAMPQERKFAGWHALLREIAAGRVGMDTFLREFESDELGMPVTEWRALDSLQALQQWWRKADSPVAQLLAKLTGTQPFEQARDIGWLPAWSAAEVYRSCAGKWHAEFSAHPTWHGEAAETGAWTYYAESPLLHDVWQQSGSQPLVRLLARIMDVVEMAEGSAARRLDAASPAADEGIAVVRTARGLLTHQVRLAAGKVAGYAIVAPTEWNFHPAGAFAQDMIGLETGSEEELKRRAQIAALSLDPCVVHEIEVRHA